MLPKGCARRVSLDGVRRLWWTRQGFRAPRRQGLTRARFVDHLEQSGGLQLDSVNVLDRAHYLTLWSRFGLYDRDRLHRWIYQDRVAYEYLGHEACVLPSSCLPRSLRAMKRFVPRGSWWQSRCPPPSVFRHVIGRIRKEGPLESAHFERDACPGAGWWEWKRTKQALEMLWYRGRLAVSSRRHFRRVYDLAERVYPDLSPARQIDCEDAWLQTALRANGVIRARHLSGYLSSPRLNAAAVRRVIARALRQGRAVWVEVEGLSAGFLMRPEDLDEVERAEAPRGTTLICPFDSLLWHRDRAEELLGFRYRIEIYLPAAQRRFGYYVLPIFHDGALVGRLDPKLHRTRGVLEIRALHLEQGTRVGRRLRQEFRACLEQLATFVGAHQIDGAATL